MASFALPDLPADSAWTHGHLFTCDKAVMKYQWLSWFTLANTVWFSALAAPVILPIQLQHLRMLLILAHCFTGWSGIYHCDLRCSLFSILFILALSLKLCQHFHQQRSSQVPKSLQEVYTAIFKAHGVSVGDFAQLFLHSRTIDLEADRILGSHEVSPTSGTGLRILLSGHMTASFQDVALHTITATQFVNSIEWKAFYFHRCISEHDIPEAWTADSRGGSNSGLRQFPAGPLNSSVSLRVDADCHLIELDAIQLDHIRISRPDLYYVLDAVVSRDIAGKLHFMNDALIRRAEDEARGQRCVLRPPFTRSLSLDTLFTASNGNLVTDNWLQFEERFLSLKCLHDPQDRPLDHDELFRKCQSDCYFRDRTYKKNSQSDVAYLLGHSHPKLMSIEVIPSLLMQAVHLNTNSCRFRDPDIVRQWNWSSATEHCGFCLFCKPQEGEEQQHRSGIKL